MVNRRPQKSLVARLAERMGLDPATAGRWLDEMIHGFRDGYALRCFASLAR